MKEKAKALETLKRLTGEYLNTGAGQEWPEALLKEFTDAVMVLSDGKNAVMTDDRGIPSVMVKIPARSGKELISCGSDRIHPAFRTQTGTIPHIWISKYQNLIINGRAYSLPFAEPLSSVSLSEADEASRARGAGWGLSSYALRACLALDAKGRGFLPGGNTELGHDYYRKEEQGIPASDGLVLTGSGPERWAHNGRWDGVFDLTGNLNEWDQGFRISDGEIQILPYAELSRRAPEELSECWRAVLPDGSMVLPGTPGTLHYQGGDGGRILIGTDSPAEDLTLNCAFGEIRAAEGVRIPELLRLLMIAPEENGSGYDGWRWVRTRGEYCPLSGGGNRVLYHAGIFFTGMTHEKQFRYNLSGFRSMYTET